MIDIEHPTNARTDRTATTSGSPIRVLSLCNVDGGGGVIETIVLRTAARANADRLSITDCCLRRSADQTYVLAENMERTWSEQLKSPGQQRDRQVPVCSMGGQR